MLLEMPHQHCTNFPTLHKKNSWLTFNKKTRLYGAVRSILGHVKDEKSGSSHKASHVNDPFSHDGGYETNKVIKFS